MKTCSYRAESIQYNDTVADRLREQADDRTREWIRLSTERARSGKFVELSDAHLKTIIDAVHPGDRQPRPAAVMSPRYRC